MKNDKNEVGFWRGYFGFMKSKKIFIHFFIALVSLVISILLLFKFLNVYTGHGEKVEVPDFSEKSIFSLDTFIQGKNINYEIADSIYLPKSKPGIVIKQEPKKGSFVKAGRTIYLYISTVLPPKMEMPLLVDRSYRQAAFMIQSFGLKLGKVKYEPGFPGAVLKQIVDGKSYTAEEIKSAKKKNKPIQIRKGSKISLVVGIEEKISIESVKKK